MKARIFGAASLLLALASPAHAGTFAIDYTDRPIVDPAENFEVDCLGATEAGDCGDRAAALQAELIDTLGSLSWMSDPETAALFESLVNMNDPRLQEVGLRYFARQAPPPTLWDKAREFFFGPDATVGHPSAEILSQSTEDIDQALADSYFDARPRAERGDDFPSGTGESDSWAQGSADDALFDDVYPFTEAERFPDATRLLMIDRFSADLYGSDPSVANIPVTGYVTDASVEEVSAHFTRVFGQKPYPSLNASLEAQQTLVNELLTLQQRLAGGDTSVLPRLQEISTELETSQRANMLGARLNLEALGAGDHVFWTNAVSDDTFTAPLERAVAVGTDSQLNRTVIRYISGAVGSPGASGSAGAGGDNGNGTATGGRSQGGRGGTGALAGSTSSGAGGGKHEDSGCGCSLPGRSQSTLALWGIAALAIAAQRGRRRFRS
jgi:hypothetical protein